MDNNQTFLKKMMTRKTKDMLSIKRANKKMNCDNCPLIMKFLEDNHMKNYVESICNIYLQHHAIKRNI
jgi:mRNA deadenylase 3'-5' endonuclease subunit Ccr4